MICHRMRAALAPSVWTIIPREFLAETGERIASTVKCIGSECPLWCPRTSQGNSYGCCADNPIGTPWPDPAKREGT